MCMPVLIVQRILQDYSRAQEPIGKWLDGMMLTTFGDLEKQSEELHYLREESETDRSFWDVLCVKANLKKSVCLQYAL